jgi:hypothetical protein
MYRCVELFKATPTRLVSSLFSITIDKVIGQGILFRIIYNVMLAVCFRVCIVIKLNYHASLSESFMQILYGVQWRMLHPNQMTVHCQIKKMKKALQRALAN